jgi:hypothetical protein
MHLCACVSVRFCSVVSRKSQCGVADILQHCMTRLEVPGVTLSTGARPHMIMLVATR